MAKVKVEISLLVWISFCTTTAVCNKTEKCVGVAPSTYLRASCILCREVYRNLFCHLGVLNHLASFYLCGLERKGKKRRREEEK